jgi:hypothetical protein
MAWFSELRVGGITPVEYLLEIVRDENQDQAVRIDAAKAAAPYCHPRINAVAITQLDPPDDGENATARALPAPDRILEDFANGVEKTNVAVLVPK